MGSGVACKNLYKETYLVPYRKDGYLAVNDLILTVFIQSWVCFVFPFILASGFS